MLLRDLSVAGLRRSFWATAFLLLGFRLWFAAKLPFTGDEAYFYWWGKIPDWGFYDHPPMVGWWLAGLIPLSESELWLRLPSVLLPTALAYGAIRCFRPFGERFAWLSGLSVLLAPAFVWNVAITTDTPLIFFSVLAGLAFIRAYRENSLSWFALTGVLYAGAVLSKYFAALLGLAFALAVLLSPNRRRVLGLLLIGLLMLPSLALMGWWNSEHCWANILFNLYNRHGDAGLSASKPFVYAAMMVYLLGFLPVWNALRRPGLVLALFREHENRAMLVLGAFPLLLFAGLSLIKTIGMHWVLSFVPFVLIAMVRAMPEDVTLRTLRFFMTLALAHVALVVGLSVAPLQTWKSTRLYDGLVLTVRADALLEKLKPYADYEWASDGYSNAVTLGYNARRYVRVFGMASSHARHDDILTDFRELAGKNILVIRKSKPDMTEYTPYFREVEWQSFDVEGARFYLIFGHDFQYEVYREHILRPVKERYYRIPPALPNRGCYFCDRYFPEESLTGRGQ